MKRQTILKSTLCLIMALVCNVTWAQPAASPAPQNGQWAEGTVWYRIKTKNNYSLRADVLTSNGHLALSNTTDANSDIALWCVVGDETNGYRFYNKAKGTEVVLGMTGSGDNAYAIFTADGTSGYATAFDFATTTSGEDYRCVKEHGSDNNYWNRLNKSDYRLKYWNSTSATNNDNGSAFMFTAVDLTTLTYATAEELTAAKDLMQEAPGYPKTTSSPCIMLDRLVTSGGVVKSELDAAVNAYKTCNDVILPEDGKAYTFTALFKNGNKLYMKYANGEKVSLSATSSDASTFVCKELRAGVYAFITEDGKILTWVGKDGNTDFYKENGNLFGYSSNYATEYNGKSDWNDITVKKNDTHEEQFGLLRLVGRRAISGNATTSSFYANKGGGFEQAGDGNLFNDDNTSAWIFTEVEYTYTTAQDLALAKIDAKIHVTANAAKLGNGIGCAYYMVSGEKKYTAADVNAAIDNATTIDVVNAIKNSYAMALPEPGKAYTMTLVANNNEKTQYKIIATDGTLEAKTEGENSVFYCLQSNSNDYPYIFVSEDGYVLGCKKLVSEYYRTDNRHNFKVGTMVNPTSGGAITSNAADRLGMVYITTAARDADTGGGGVGCLIFKYTANSTTAWDNSSAPYHDGTYTSAIVMTEVESYKVPELQQTKVDAILGKDALKTQLDGIKDQLKDQPGYYYCTIGGEKMYSADDIIAAIDATQSLKTLNEISTAVAGKTLIVPEVGKYYRLKGKTSGNYIDASGQNKAQMNMKAEPDYLGSIFLLDEGSRWLNMSTGTYVYNTHSIGETKANANTWEFILVSTGYFKVKSNYSSSWLHDSGNKANRCQNDGSDHEFIIEEVTEFPVTLTTFGENSWATLYAPVALRIPADVTAYTGTLNGEWLTLNAIQGGAIPAKTAVILGGAAGNYSFFEVTTGVKAIGENILRGTETPISTEEALRNAPEVTNGVVYTLQPNENENGVVFKPYADDNNPNLVLKANKAYLVLPAGTGANAISIRFEGSTDIEHSTLNPQPSTQIYDLLGRRVETMTKGGIYIVNGKKVIK